VLDEVINEFSASYQFNEFPDFEIVYRLLLVDRLMARSWWATASPPHRLRILQALRVLTRDVALQQVTVAHGGLSSLCSELALVTMHWFAGTDGAYVLESLVELTSIIKRFAAATDPHAVGAVVGAAAVGSISPTLGQEELFKHGVHRSLVQLLSCTEPLILQASLLALLYLSDWYRLCPCSFMSTTSKSNYWS
jgi:hypothetical protein